MKLCDITYQWNRTSIDPIRLVSNSFTTRDNRQNTCIHVNTYMKTHTGGAVPIMNQYDMFQLVQKWFLKIVCWDVAIIVHRSQYSMTMCLSVVHLIVNIDNSVLQCFPSYVITKVCSLRGFSKPHHPRYAKLVTLANSYVPPC